MYLCTGLPPDHSDVLLGLIVRSRRHHSDISSPQPIEKIVTEVSVKRYHSASHEVTEVGHSAKRAKLVMEVGVNGETPPHVSGFQDGIMEGDSSTKTQDGGSTTPRFSSEDTGRLHVASSGIGTKRKRQSSGAEGGLQTIAGPTSFFGSHQPLSPEQAKNPSRVTGKVDTKPQVPAHGHVLSPSKTSINLSSTILSQFSKEKLKDLVSAVSKIANSTTPLNLGGGHTSSLGSHVGRPAVSTLSGQKRTVIPDYGANTPPEDSDHLDYPLQDRLPQVASGPPFPQQGNMRGSRPAVGEQQYRNQNATSLQSQGNQEWNRDKAKRFANTPPPEFQAFNDYQSSAIQQTHQQIQAAPHHGNNGDQRGQTYPQQHPHVVNPHMHYNSNSYTQQHEQMQSQEACDYPAEEGVNLYDPRRRYSREGEGHNGGRGRGHFHRGRGGRGAMRGNQHRGSYSQQRRGKYEKQQYPAEWYRK